MNKTTTKKKIVLVQLPETSRRVSLRARFLGEAIFERAKDCFVVKSTPRNDTTGELPRVDLLQKITVFCITVMVLLIAPVLAHADDSKEPAPIKSTLKAVPMAPDKVGTNVRQIYDLTVDCAVAQVPCNQQYIVIFYLDDVYLEGFRNQSLPMSFRQNFRGLTAGEHKIKADVEDNSNNGVVLASETITIDVTKE